MDLEYIRRFHGHIGPFVILGYRIGERIRNMASSEKIRIEIFVEDHPPVSCIADGIQLSTGSTLGRGLFRIRKTDGRRRIIVLDKERENEYIFKNGGIERILKMLEENKLRDAIKIAREIDLKEIIKG